MSEKSVARKLDRPVDGETDHILGDPDAEITLVEYGSYSCEHCHGAHEVIANLRDRFGDRMRYVFRHLPIAGSESARPAAALAEYVYEKTGEFWPIHDVLMHRGPDFTGDDLDQIASEHGLKADGSDDPVLYSRAEKRVRDDRRSALLSGARVTPTFYINDRRYEGPWDENALAEAMLGSLGHRIHSAALNFVRWGPSTGLLLLLMSVLAVVLVNTQLGPAFEAFWHQPAGFRTGSSIFELPLVDWINEGLLSIFFLVVGLEIKREFTIGHLSTLRAAALPIAASLGGMIVPALIYILLIPAGPFAHGWGITIATDTAFAIALIVLLGDRVAVELRVFLTAAVIVDDLVAIAVVAVFYSGDLHLAPLIASVVVMAALAAMNRWHIYRPLPYFIGGVLLWVLLHDAGLHATLAGVILAVLTPTRPPGNLHALLAQAENILQEETRRDSDRILRHGPSEPAMHAIDAIFDRIESPADKLLRTLEPWSSYVVLPVFALANAGVALSSGLIAGHTDLVLTIVLGLAVGKPLGISFAAYLTVRLGLGEKPDEYSWRQLIGAGALAGIGFTMSLFIAGQAFSDSDDFAAAKVAVFAASILAGAAGVAILWKRPSEIEEVSVRDTECPADGEHSPALES